MNKSKVISSFAFKFIERLAVKGIGLVIGIILARLLNPEIFGLIAIITVFVNLAHIFAQSGLGTALVQNRTTDEGDYSTVFYLSTGIAVIMICILFVSAPLIGQYYENTALVWPLRVYSFSLLFGALNSVQNAKMQREMRFKTMMRCNLLATVLSGVIGIILAFVGAGLWALIGYYASHQILVAVCMMVVQRWYPRWVFSVKRAKELFSFGWKMLVSSLLQSIYADIRSLIIGGKYSTADLAYYNKGQQFPLIVGNTLAVSVESVMLPVMASKQDSEETLRKLLLQTVKMAMFVVVPVMLGLGVVSQTLIPILLTEKWNASVPLMRAFCFAYVALPIETVNLSFLKAIGRSDIYMKTEAIRRVVMLAVLLTTVLFFDSVLVIAIGYALGYWLDAWIIVWQVKRLSKIGWIEQMKALWKTFLAAAVMVAVVLLINMISCPNILKLFMQIILGAATYIAVSAALKNESFQTVKVMALKTLKKKGD